MTAGPATGSVRHANAAAIPHAASAAFLIAKTIYEKGAMTEAEIFCNVSYNTRPSNRRRLIDDYLESDWLIRVADKIGISHRAIEHFDEVEQDKPDAPAVKYLGQIAGPRDTGSVYSRPPLSKRNIPSSRGFRADVPEYSVRDGQSFYTKA